MKIKYRTIRRANSSRADCLSEAHTLIESEWGKIPTSYGAAKLWTSDVFVGAYLHGRLLGFSTYRHLHLKNSGECVSIDIILVDSQWRGHGIGRGLLARTIANAFMSTVRKSMSGKVEIFFLTTNVSFIQAIKEISVFLYPDPSLFEVKKNSMSDPDSITWNKIKEYVRLTGERNFRLQKNGCVIVRSFDDVPSLIDRMKQSSSNDEMLRRFAKRYLKENNKYGNEIVVRAVCSLRLFIRFLIIQRYKQIVKK